MSRIVASLVALLVCAPLLASSNDAGWQSDIRYLTSELPKRHKNAFFRTSRATFESASARLIAAVPALSDSDVAVGVMQLVALLGDSHTTAGGPPPANFPLELYWLDEGLFVTRAAEADLLGARLLAVDGHDVDEVTNAVATVFAYENDAWRRARTPAFAVSADVLHAIRLIGDARAATFTFAAADGTTFERRLIADNAAMPFATPPTHAAERPELNYWAEYLPSQRAVFLRYNRCRNDPAKPFAAFLNELMATIGSRPVERFVLDVRENGGGDTAVLQPLITALQSNPQLNRADRLFVLIGRATFSSAMLNAIQLDQQTNATLVGEPTGGKPNEYGEVLAFQLPSSRMTVFYSTKYFQVVAGDPPSVEPELAVPTAAGAFLRGEDAVWNAVLPPRPRRRSAAH